MGSGDWLLSRGQQGAQGDPARTFGAENAAIRKPNKMTSRTGEALAPRPPNQHFAKGGTAWSGGAST